MPKVVMLMIIILKLKRDRFNKQKVYDRSDKNINDIYDWGKE